MNEDACNLVTVELRTDDGRISTQASPPFEEGAKIILQELAKVSPAWRDGYSMGLGFVPFVLRGDDQEFTVEVPDLTSSDPTIQRSEDITPALELLQSQTSLVDQLNIMPEAVWYEQGYMVLPGWETAEVLQMTRAEDEELEPELNGWVLEPYPPKDYDMQDVQLAAGWRVFQTNAAVVKASSIPFGHLAIVDQGEVMLVVRLRDMETIAEGPLQESGSRSSQSI